MSAGLEVRRPRVRARYRTKLGRMYCGKAEEILRATPPIKWKGKVQLVFTSPPFPLNTKKSMAIYKVTITLNGSASSRRCCEIMSLMTGQSLSSLGMLGKQVVLPCRFSLSRVF